MEPVLVHELSHALQDQWIDLQEFVKEERSIDQVIARRQVLEGEAELICDLYAKTYGLGQEPADVAGSSPECRFARLVYEEHGPKGLDAMTVCPPESTAQVLHPRKYFARRPGPHINVPDVTHAMRGVSRVVDSGTLGESMIYDWAVAMGVREAESSRGAEGWVDDVYWVVARSDAEELSCFWWTMWDTEADALEFQRLAESCLRRLYKRQADHQASYGTTKSEFVAGNTRACVEVRREDVVILRGMFTESSEFEAVLDAAWELRTD